MEIKNFKWLLLLFTGLILSCNSDDDRTPVEENEEITSGTADFSHYVALGNSLTSGYTDGTVFLAGQQNSLPNILAQQFTLAGGGEFSQPLVNDNVGGLLLLGNPVLEPRLIFNGEGIQRISATPTTEISEILTGPFNNLGVPDAKSFHLIAPNYGNIQGVATRQANPYFVRFASSPGTTVLQDALAQDPTFFSLWIGPMDVLAFATSGGSGVNQAGNPDPSTYSRNDLTDPDVFAQVYSGLVTSLTANGAKGVVANIPMVTSIPYFNTVSHNPLSPTNPDFESMIPTLNATFEGFNQVFEALGEADRSINFSTTEASAVVIKDESLTDLSQQITGALLNGGVDEGTAQLFGFLYGQARQATEGDLVVLPGSSVIGQLNTDAFEMLKGMGIPPQTAGQLAINGITFPLEDRWVLAPSEQQEVQTAIAAFNQTIWAVAEQHDLAFVDIHSIFNELAESGMDFDQFTLTTDLVFGGAFSLDGVHPTARGYAFLANQFIEAINDTYGSNLPPVKANDYSIFHPSSL